MVSSISKTCACGCGGVTRIAGTTDARYGTIAGQPRRFIKGHSLRGEKHGASFTPEYKRFADAKGRCVNPKSKAWRDYGGRGIEFRFQSFKQFIEEVGPRPTNKHELDRKFNDGHYEPGNVRWVTHSENIKNRRKLGAITRFTDTELLAEISRRQLAV